jgi:hypothetical protein
MKLFVDDERPCPPGWELARTVTEAIRMLDTVPFDEVSLGYDAGGEETFEPVARFIAVKNGYSQEYELYSPLPKITIHSSNPVGAESMRLILKGAWIISEYKPYEVPIQQ